MQIAVLEDDHRISDFLVKGLEEQGHFVLLSKSAEEFFDHFEDRRWDLIIADIMLPGLSGMDLVSTLRYRNEQTPILMLSALNSVQDKVQALDLGADDYLTKPFHFEELLSRIKALTRRGQQSVTNDEHLVKAGDLTIDREQFKVFENGEEIDLPPREFKLLLYLVENRDRAVSRMQLLDAVWGIQFDNQSNVVDVYISYVRNKIEKRRKYIHTVKGIGYLFKTEA